MFLLLFDGLYQGCRQELQTKSFCKLGIRKKIKNEKHEKRRK